MKYIPLGHYLAKLKTEKWIASFKEIEHILGFPLPRSARQYPAWWANQEYGTATVWVKAGWFTSGLDLHTKTVIFSRGQKVKKTKANLIKKVAHAHSRQDTQEANWDEAESLSCELKMEWAPVGIAALKEGKLSFPSVPATAGLYRFRIRDKTGLERRYIGESENLHQRLHQNYRHGNIHQPTNHRISHILTKALEDGCEISVSIVIENAWISYTGNKRPAALQSKVERLLFESFAQCIEGDKPIESLNKAKSKTK